MQVSTAVRYWLLLGVIMVFGQVWLGGVTRLTGSGLSITEWQPILGTLPPFNETEWAMVFEKYKTATTQYQQLNVGMSLAEFKWIFFWEFTHRLWARIMGFVFIFPFLYFLFKKMLPTRLIKILGVAIGFAAVAATFGWLMVWTGIKGNPLTNPRAWVNAYALSAHLALGFGLFGTLSWAVIETWQPNPQVINKTGLKKWAWSITAITGLQIIFGGWMSGMKAGLAYPSFPLMNGEIFPSALMDSNNWQLAFLTQYDHNAFAPALIHILHRTTAYLLIISILWFWWSLKKHNVSNTLRLANNLLLAWIFVQALLGIFTVINCVGHIPVALGVIHQDGALVLLFISLWLNYQFINEIEIKPNDM